MPKFQHCATSYSMPFDAYTCPLAQYYCFALAGPGRISRCRIRWCITRCPTTAPSFHPLGDKPAPGNHHISDAPKSESASPNDPVCHLVIVLSHSQFPKRHVTAPDLNSFLGVMVRSRNSERHKRVIWFPLPINITAETQPSHTHPEP